MVKLAAQVELLVVQEVHAVAQVEQGILLAVKQGVDEVHVVCHLPCLIILQNMELI